MHKIIFCQLFLERRVEKKTSRSTQTHHAYSESLTS